MSESFLLAQKVFLVAKPKSAGDFTRKAKLAVVACGHYSRKLVERKFVSAQHYKDAFSALQAAEAISVGAQILENLWSDASFALTAHDKKEHKKMLKILTRSAHAVGEEAFKLINYCNDDTLKRSEELANLNNRPALYDVAQPIINRIRATQGLNSALLQDDKIEAIAHKIVDVMKQHWLPETDDYEQAVVKALSWRPTLPAARTLG